MGAAAGIGTFLKSLLVVFGALILTNVRLESGYGRHLPDSTGSCVRRSAGRHPGRGATAPSGRRHSPRCGGRGDRHRRHRLVIYGMLNAGEEGWTDLGALLPSGAAASCTGCSCSSSAPYRLP